MNMKRLIFVVEGDTEQAFVGNIIVPYFLEKFQFSNVNCYKIKHSGGGISKYSHIRKDLVNSINESDSVVTTMADFYKLPKDTPHYKDSKSCVTDLQQVEYLEKAMQEDLSIDYPRAERYFIPYIQLHEFEALLFSSEQAYDQLFEDKEVDFKRLRQVMKTFPNPENINNGESTAPSKRLMNLMKGYNKVVHGVQIASEIGIDTLIKKCPHFRSWIDRLSKCMK